MLLNNGTNTTLPASGQQTSATLATTIASASFVVIVMLLTILGNFLVCYSVFYYHRLRSPTNYLIVSLAVSDLFVGTFSLPFRLAQLLNGEKWPAFLGREGCQFWIWLDMLCSGASIVNLAGISIDRLLAIKRPLRYREEMTTKRAFFTILFVWTYALLYASLSFVDWEGEETITHIPQCGIKAKVYITIGALAAFFCPLLIVLVCYGLVLQIAIRHGIQLQKEKDSMAVNFSPEANCNRKDSEGSLSSSPVLSLKTVSRSGSTTKKEIDMGNGSASKCKSPSSTFNIMKQIKATKTLAVVVGVFIICWFPFFVIFLTFQYCGIDCFREERISRTAKQSILIIFVYVLPVSNSAVNPIIYSYFNKEFRVAFLKIFYKVLRKTYRHNSKYERSTAAPFTHYG